MALTPQYSKQYPVTTKTILIVDDDISLVEVYRARLEIEGYNIVTKYDGEEALKWLAGQDADLIIMDCLLPKFGGLSVLEALINERGKKFKTPVIMVSGLDRPEYKQKAEQLGAFSYLVKSSVSISEMVDVVADAFSKKPREIQLKDSANRVSKVV